MSFPPIEPRRRPANDANEREASGRASQSGFAWIAILAMLVAGGAVLVWNDSAQMDQTERIAALTTNSAPAR